MKSMIVVSMLVASSMAQLALSPYSYAPGYATGYATGYGYNTFSAGRTALDVFPTAAYPAVAYNAYAYNGFPYAYNYGSYAPAFAAAAPAAAVVAAEPAAAPAAVVKTAAADAEIVEAVPAEVAVEAPAIRPIFPVFTSDLRGGSPFIQFARPSEIAAIKVEDAEKEDFVVITPEARSLALPASAATAPVFPAGIFQAQQPRFYSAFPFAQPILKA